MRKGRQVIKQRILLTYLLLISLTFATSIFILPPLKAESKTFTLSGHSLVVFATIQNAEDETPVMYTLRISIDGQGSTSPAPGSYTYENGSEISIGATDTSSLYGFLFEYWVLDGSITISKKNHNPLQLTMDQDHILTAVFLQAPQPYFPPESTASPSSTPKPTVTPTPTPKSTPEIPELTPLVILPLFMIATLLAGVFCFKKRKR
jgi:hypothetical protein